ncbi:type II toxin-antitoxin system RelE/ParE family toxin [Orrella sp. 11846]|uniref:type II toxin-antitoxin system RelE/ParE family toxin n=1 Tax=Orrella sp. 11846 TaxID=3409913 RepID=UPI003B58F1C2
MSYSVRFTPAAKADLERLYAFLVERDYQAAERALDTISNAWRLLEQFPFSCRKADDANPFLRELIISFGHSGYVALFEIEDNATVTILAVRHQLEDDYF